MRDVTKSERIRFLRIGGFGRVLQSNDEQLLNSDVNDAKLIFTTIINLIILCGNNIFCKLGVYQAENTTDNPDSCKRSN